MVVVVVVVVVTTEAHSPIKNPKALKGGMMPLSICCELDPVGRASGTHRTHAPSERAIQCRERGSRRKQIQ